MAILAAALVSTAACGSRDLLAPANGSALYGTFYLEECEWALEDGASPAITDEQVAYQMCYTMYTSLWEGGSQCVDFAYEFMDHMAAGRVYSNTPFIWVGQLPKSGVYDSTNDQIHIGYDYAGHLPKLVEELAHRTYWDQGFNGTPEGEALTGAWVSDFIAECAGPQI